MDISQFSTATLHEANNKKGALPFLIKPIDLGMRLSGIAYPLKLNPGDNYLLHKAIYTAKPNSIIVAETAGIFEYGYWGEIMSMAAIKRGIKGVIIDGCVRDSESIIAMNFPVFCRGVHIQGTTKYKKTESSLGVSVFIGDTVVNPGDLVEGDRDGVVVIPAQEKEAVIERAIAIEEKEKQVRTLITKGHTTMEIFNLEKEKS